MKHVALGAYRGEVLVGVAHYETLADPHAAEIAFVVDGAVQARGLGTLLLEHLASVARHRGVRRFVAEVLAQSPADDPRDRRRWSHLSNAHRRS